MGIEIDVQVASKSEDLPTSESLRLWATEALLSVAMNNSELTIRIVDENEMRVLNRDYRNQDKPTNVLSFPFEDPPGLKTFLLGDIIICAPVVEREANEFSLAHNERWAHMVIHGVLHLCGYDHIQDNEANMMMQQELQILERLGIESGALTVSVLGDF